MQIVLNKNLSQKVSKFSKLLDREAEEIISLALQYYFEVAQKQMSLQEEFNTWDKLSDEALANFEKCLLPKSI